MRLRGWEAGGGMVGMGFMVGVTARVFGIDFCLDSWGLLWLLCKEVLTLIEVGGNLPCP